MSTTQPSTGSKPANPQQPPSAPTSKEKHRYQLAGFPPGLRTVDRKACHDRSIFSFLVLPETDDQEGLFPIGELSLIAGASGSWKTTVILFFVWLWSHGERFFGRRTCPGTGKYLIVSFDRSQNGFARTAIRMGFDPNDFRLVELGRDEYSDRDPRKIIEDIVTQDEFQDIQFLIVEGIDLKAGDVDVSVHANGNTRKTTGGIGDSHLVSKMMHGLQKIARDHHFALLASIGSPKQKSSDKYTSKRDQIIGSQAWARMAETVVHLAQEDEDDPNGKRSLSFLPRNGRDEVIPITLDENRRPARAPEEPPADKQDVWKQILDWIRSDASGIKPGDTFTPKQVSEALPHIKPDTVAKTLKRMVKYESNGIEHVDHGRYRRKAAEPDAFEGQI
jgi:hypothetical protein